MTVFVKENQTVAQDTDRSATFFFSHDTCCLWDELEISRSL